MLLISRKFSFVAIFQNTTVFYKTTTVRILNVMKTETTESQRMSILKR